MSCLFGWSATIWGYLAGFVSLVAAVVGAAFAISFASRGFRGIGLFVTVTIILICSVGVFFIGQLLFFFIAGCSV